MNASSLAEALNPTWLQATLLVTGAAIFVVTEWRLVLLALLGQYVAAGLLFRLDGLPAAAGSQILSGAVACAVIYITARTGAGESLRVRRTQAEWVLRIITAALLAVGVVGVVQPGEWLSIPTASLSGALWLAAIGLLVVALSRHVLRVGLGLLTFQTGCSLLYLHLDSGLAVIGLLGSITVALALVVAVVAETWSTARP